MSNRLQPCFCNSHKCNGKKIRASDISRYLGQDEEKRRHLEKCAHLITSDTLVQEVFRMTLKSDTSTADSKRGEAIWKRDSCNVAQGVLRESSDVLPIFNEFVPDYDPSPAPSASAATTSETPARARLLYDLVLAIDYDIEKHVNAVAESMSKPVSTTSDDSLKREEQWFLDTFHNVHAINPGGDQATYALRVAMIDRVTNELSLIEAERRKLGRVANVITPQNTFNTGQ